MSGTRYRIFCASIGRTVHDGNDRERAAKRHAALCKRYPLAEFQFDPEGSFFRRRTLVPRAADLEKALEPYVMVPWPAGKKATLEAALRDRGFKLSEIRPALKELGPRAAEWPLAELVAAAVETLSRASSQSAESAVS